MRTVLLVIGIMAMFIGTLWFGQGMGFFPYPSFSFMVNQTQWAHYGAELAMTGLVLIVLSQRGVKKVSRVVKEEKDEDELAHPSSTSGDKPA